MHDLHFQGGQVIDGSGAPAYRADVAIEGDRIAAVGDLTGQPARRVIRLDDRVLDTEKIPQGHGYVHANIHAP